MSHTLPIQRVHHVGCLTKRLEASRAFYRDVLGFQEIPRPPLKFAGAWLAGYGLQIHLIYDETLIDPQGPIESRVNHLAFEVTDIDDVERRLQKHDVMYQSKVQVGTGLKQIFFHDPDGHTLECAMYGEG